MLSAVIGLCEILGVASVAEHVASEELLQLVVDLGCTAGQGFWLKPPAAAEDIRDLLEIRTGTLPLRSSEPNLRAA